MLEDIPFKIQTGVEYSVWLGIGNQMGTSTYYNCFVKLRNGVEPLHSQTLGTPSSLPVLYVYHLFIQDGGNWETLLTFQFNRLAITDQTSHLSSITINGVDFFVNKDSAFNSENGGYYYSLFLELWILNSQSNIEYHNRSVHLNLYVNN